MNPASDKQVSPGNAGEELFASPFTSPEELISFARGHYAEDFPNPERLGCPPPADLESRVRSGHLPDERLRTHLFGCSECFRAYRSVLAAHRLAPKDQSAPGPLRPEVQTSRAWLPAFAGALALLILLFTGIYFWRQYRAAPDNNIIRKETPPLAPADNNANASVGSNPSSPPSTPPGPVRTPGVTEQANLPKPPQQRAAPPRRHALPDEQQRGAELAAVTPVGIDLQKYVITRGREPEGADEVIKLPRARLRLLLKLPEGSDSGTYTVSIIDGSGKALAAAPKVRSADGRTLSVTIDTTRLDPQRYNLRVVRRGALAEFYPVMIGGAGAVTP
jgi:hypothetical protein